MPKKRDMSGFFKQVKEVVPQERNNDKFKAVENLFHPTYKDGKTEVVFRFLPPHVDEFKPFVMNQIHIQKGFGCDCLEKFGKKCPICEHNHALWKKYPKTSDKETAVIRDSKLITRAKQLFFSNILVVRNDNAPDTEGKVFRYQFGPAIMKLIDKAMSGYEDSEDGWQEGFNPFDWTEGANFTLKSVEGAYGPNYDESKFGKQKAINRYDRATKTYIPLDTVEMDEIEAKLYTLDECEKKEEDCRTADKVVEYAERKFGFTLWKLGEDGKPIVPTEDNEDLAKASYSRKNESKSDASDDFAGEFAGSSTDSDDEDISSVNESAASNDDEAFFSEIENM